MEELSRMRNLKYLSIDLSDNYILSEGGSKICALVEALSPRLSRMELILLNTAIDKAGQLRIEERLSKIPNLRFSINTVATGEWVTSSARDSKPF